MPDSVSLLIVELYQQEFGQGAHSALANGKATAYKGAMMVIHDTVEGDVIFRSDTDLRGTVTGSVRVERGIKLELRGTVAGDLSLAKDSTVELRGTVKGNVTNRGGSLNVYGVIKGRLTTDAGTSGLFSKSIIDGVVTP
jgi:hypothetical protein